MKSKKIVICTAQVPFMQGGNEKLVAGLRRELVKRGKNVDVISIPFKWYPPQRLITESMIWRLIDIAESDGSKIDMVIATKFPSTVVKHPDKRLWLVHQYRPVYDLYGTEFGDHFRNEMAFTTENVSIKQMVTKIDDITIREATRVCAISNTVSERLRKYNRIDSLTLYPPPDNIEKFHNETYGNYILSVGRLDAKKRVSLLIDAFKFVKTGIKCIIVGTGKARETLERQAQDLGLSERITFTGYVQDEEVIRLYANALAVYYAPYDEDYGFTTVEAFLSSKPVITTTDSGGVLEFVKDGENGLVSGASHEEIADKINWLFAHKSQCRQFGANGHETVREITWDRVIERLVD